MSERRPVVSVCIPAYNAEPYVAAAVESVLGQTFSDFEFLIFDDCSSDATVEVISRYRDPRLRFERNPRNLGPEGNWNLCLDRASGRYIKLLPSDDTLYPTCLARQVEILERPEHAGVAFVYCARDVTDEQGRKRITARFPYQGLLAPQRLARATVRWGTNVIGEPGAVLFRAELARKAGSFDASIPYIVDLDYWLRLLRFGGGYAIRDALCTFRITSKNWSVRLGRSRRRDYVAFLRKIHASGWFPISRVDLARGIAAAYVNEICRSIAYRTIFGLPSAVSG